MTNVATTRPDASEYAPYYEKYISLVPAGEVVATLSEQLDETLALLRGLSEEQAGARYAPDKWSIKEVVGHVIDTERIFSHRALRFARNDQTPLPGYEQDDYVRAAGFDRRTLADIASEFEHVRRATLALLRSLDAEAWLRRGLLLEPELPGARVARVAGVPHRRRAGAVQGPVG